MSPIQPSAVGVAPLALDAAPRRIPRDEAAHLAHELNNLLAVIVGHADALDAFLLDPTLDRSSIEAIRLAVASAAEVTKRVRGLGHPRAAQPTAVDLNRVVRAVEADFGLRFHDRLTVAVHATPHPWSVSVEPGLVEDTLGAVVAHAADVAPHGATISLRTMNVEMGVNRPHLAGSIHRARYVRLEVSFTQSAGAAGLTPPSARTDGAATTPIDACFAAIVAAGGRVSVDTDGATVVIASLLLPSDGRDAGRSAAAAHGTEPDTTPEVQTIVLHDSDGARRALLHKILRAQHYHVVAAASDADVTAAAGQGRIDLLVADRPSKSVHFAETEARSSAPVRVLYTGRVDLAPGAFGAAAVTTLPTPFGAAQLVAAVRGLLSSAQRTPGTTRPPVAFKHGSTRPIPTEECLVSPSTSTASVPDGSR